MIPLTDQQRAEKFSMQLFRSKVKKSLLVVLLHKIFGRTLFWNSTEQRAECCLFSYVQWSRLEPARSSSCFRTPLTDPRGRILGWWRGIFQGIWWDYRGLSSQWWRATSEPLYRCDMRRHLSHANTIMSRGRIYLNCKWVQLDNNFFLSFPISFRSIGLFCLYRNTEGTETRGN